MLKIREKLSQLLLCKFNCRFVSVDGIQEFTDMLELHTLNKLTSLQDIELKEVISATMFY